jgi:O-antigen ligase
MAFLSTLIASGFAAAVLLFKRLNDPGRRPRMWQWIAALTVPLLIAVFLPTRELVLRFSELAATDEISRDDRIQIWRDTTKVIADYPWTGTGLGAYERGLYRHKTVAPTRTVDFAHNDYLQAMAELGIAGSIPAAALALWIFSKLVRSVFLRRDSRNWEWSVGLLAAGLAIAVHSLADFNLYVPANALTFAWLSGVAVSLGVPEG